MSRRTRRVVPAVVAGLALLALGAWAATAALGHLLGQDPTGTAGPLARALAGAPWQDPVVVAAGAVLLLLGLLALLAALLPGRRVVLALQGAGATGPRAGITRTGLRRAVAAAAEDVDGVDRADATVRDGRVEVRARSGLRDVGDLRARVEQAVTDRLAAIPLARRPRVQVRTTTTRSDA
ncbi:DUF6286 domain-containing protein [Jannaschia sp. R86511]|uniref:DUF6286 domain-containing protein n=1 Tax=Jannaschia sp. R86511 TaxID=3093853 RepID=UPI0036D2571D